MIPTEPSFRFTADTATAARMARADARLRMPTSTISAALFGTLGVLVLVLAIATSSPMLGVLGATQLMLALLTAMAGVSVARAARRSADELYVPGAEFTSSFGPVLHLGSPRRETTIPYSAIVAVRSRHDAVLIALGTQPSFTIPVELCPPQLRLWLQNARTAPVPPAAVGRLPVAFPVDEPFLRAVGARMRQRTLRTPSLWASAALLIAVLAAYVIASPAPLLIAAISVPIAIAGCGAAWLVMSILGRRVTRSFRGAVLYARFDDDGFALLDRGVYSRRRYDALRDVVVAGDAVEFRTPASADPELLPTRLFPAEVLARLTRGAVAVV